MFGLNNSFRHGMVATALTGAMGISSVQAGTITSATISNGTDTTGNLVGFASTVDFSGIFAGNNWFDAWTLSYAATDLVPGEFLTVTGVLDAGTVNLFGVLDLPNQKISVDETSVLNGGGSLTLRDTIASLSATTTTLELKNFTLSAGVQPVPVPAAAVLFGSGLLGMLGMSKVARRTDEDRAA